jgi:hypothetical protein
LLGINRKAVELARAEGKNPHERYLSLFRHIQDSDDIAAQCFNDWRRSVFDRIILNLRHNRLLTDEHAKHLSPEAQKWLRFVGISLQRQ